MSIIIAWLVSAIVIMILAYILPGISVSGFFAALVVSVVLGLVNAFIRPIVVFLTLPLNILTLGLFTFIINALMIMLVAFLVPGFQTKNIWWALLFSILLSLVMSIIPL